MSSRTLSVVRSHALYLSPLSRNLLMIVYNAMALVTRVTELRVHSVVLGYRGDHVCSRDVRYRYEAIKYEAPSVQTAHCVQSVIYKNMHLYYCQFFNLLSAHQLPINHFSYNRSNPPLSRCVVNILTKTRKQADSSKKTIYFSAIFGVEMDLYSINTT